MDSIICEECGGTSKWVGNFRIGLYQGYIANYECVECKHLEGIDVPPTQEEQEKNKRCLQNIAKYKGSYL